MHLVDKHNSFSRKRYADERSYDYRSSRKSPHKHPSSYDKRHPNHSRYDNKSYSSKQSQYETNERSKYSDTKRIKMSRQWYDDLPKDASVSSFSDNSNFEFKDGYSAKWNTEIGQPKYCNVEAMESFDAYNIASNSKMQLLMESRKGFFDNRKDVVDLNARLHKRSLLGDSPSNCDTLKVAIRSDSGYSDHSNRSPLSNSPKKSLLGDAPKGFAKVSLPKSNKKIPKNKPKDVMHSSTRDADKVEAASSSPGLSNSHINHEEQPIFDPFKALGDKYKVIDYNHQQLPVEVAPVVTTHTDINGTHLESIPPTIKSSSTYASPVHDECINDQIKSLAALISCPVKSPTPLLTVNDWHPILLEPPLRMVFTKFDLDISKCCKDDPRIRHLLH